MTKIVVVVLALLWISSLIILIIALTDIYPNNPFEEYKLIVGLGFIAIAGFLRIIYKQILDTNSKGKI